MKIITSVTEPTVQSVASFPGNAQQIENYRALETALNVIANCASIIGPIWGAYIIFSMLRKHRAGGSFSVMRVILGVVIAFGGLNFANIANYFSNLGSRCAVLFN